MREIILDTETTGLNPAEGHKVIEIAALEVVDFLPTGKTFHKYINPERDVPQQSTEIHGLTIDFLSDKKIFRKIADELEMNDVKYDMTFWDNYTDEILTRIQKPEPRFAIGGLV